MIEAVIFNVTDSYESVQMLIWGIPLTALSAIILVAVFNGDKERNQPSLNHGTRSVKSWILKVLAGNVLYFLFYFIAGMTLTMVFPKMMEYYGDKIPPFHQIIITNLFFRGFIFVGVGILIDRTVGLGVLKTAILTGLLFAVLGGIAPLIPPNELMPQYIRIAHGFEVGISNFLYGVALTYIITQKSKIDVSNDIKLNVKPI